MIDHENLEREYVINALNEIYAWHDEAKSIPRSVRAAIARYKKHLEVELIDLTERPFHSADRVYVNTDNYENTGLSEGAEGIVQYVIGGFDSCAVKNPNPEYIQWCVHVFFPELNRKELIYAYDLKEC